MLSSRCILFVTNGFTILFGALMACASGCQFELWSEYKYQYRAAAEVKGVALSPSFELTCTVFVRTSQTRCHAQFQVSGCDLKEFDGVRERDVQDSKYLIEELERHPFFVKYPSSTENNSRNSTISQAELYASPSDTVSVLNLKRGIVSALQLPSVPQLHQKQSQKSQLLQTVQNDIFGSCPTELTISSLHDGRLTVETTRDLVVCNLSFVSRIQQSSLSFIKVIVGGAKHAPIAELTYAHESKVTCKYQYLTNVSIMNFESMNCKQTQGLDPGGDFGKRTLAHITQDVKLISKSGTSSDSELDIGKSIKIAWAMDLQQEAESGISDDENDDILYGGKGDAHHVEEVLQKAMYDYLSQGEIQEREHLDRNITSISFRRLVVLMQRMDNLELTLLSATVLSCRDVPLCNMPFKHRASNDVIQDYCTRKKSWWCWLSFSAMLHRLYDNDPDKSKTKKIIFKSVSSLLGMMASTCEHGKLDALSIPARHSAEGSLAIAVKAIINLGASVQDVHDSNFAHNADGTVLRALLHCVRNSDIKLVIAKDSVKAIKSMGAHQFIVSELLELIRDESKSVVLRAAMFDLLVTQDSFQTLNAALGLIQETQMENLKTYIMTKISAILECQDPAGKSLRATLREVMQEHRFSALGDKILSKSHITHISRYFTVPLTQLELGGWLTLTLIYTPSSSMLHSATLSFGVIANEVKTKVMDISLDFEGMDTLKEVLEKEYLWGSYKTLKSTDLKKILDILQEYIKKVTREKPTRFSYLRRSIWSAIEEITAVVNLKKATFPRMAVSISTLGYEFGFFSSDDILKFWNSKKMEKRMMKNLKHVATSGIETALFHALKVLEDRKVLPTAAGFVLKNIIDVTAIHKTSIEVDSNAFKFLSGKRNDIEAHFLIKPSLSFAVYTDLKVKVPAYSSIGMDASVYGVLQTDLSTDVRLEPPSSADSGTFTLQFSKQVPTKPFNFMHVDADSYTLQNGVKLKIEPSAKPILSELCLPDIYATLTGRRACIKMTKANPSNSYPWNLNDPLQPFMLKGYLTTEDSHLQKYNVDILFQKIPAKRYNFEMLIHAPGTLVSREVKISLNRDNLTRGIQLMCHVPDADLTYTLESKLLSNKTFSHHTFSSILKQAGSCTNSVIFERSSEVLTADSLRSRTSSLTKSVHQSSAMFNITVSGLLSLELQNKYKMTDEGFSNMDVFFTYYCHPRLRLLYSLHPDTLMASNNGHRSKFSFHQEFDSVDLFAENRRGFFIITLQAPGQNLTSVTTIEKTLKGTQRDSDIYWTTLYGKNFLHTTSQVNNLSTAAHFHFNYSLTATKNNEYDVILKGRVLGPWENPIADLDVSADIEYTQRNLEINTKKKRTKRSFSTMMESLGNMEEAIEEKALSLFHTVKQSLLNMFSGSEDDVQGTAKLNTKEDTVRKSKFKDEISHQRPSLWQRPRWSVGLSAKCNISSHIEPTIAKLDVSGPLLGWDIRAIMPKCGTPLFQINGTAFTGKHITYTKWFRIYMWDQIHHLSLGAWLDHRSNPHEFLHQHNWTLIETDRHSMDRSFLACVHLQSENSFHYNRFISDIELKAPLTNLSHHIDYNRISPTKHKVRVYALLHNIKPSFDMAYIEQTDLIDGSLDTHINLTSSVLDYQLDVCGKSNAGSSSTLDGRLQVDSRVSKTE
ncbi:apolipoprotein b-100 [Plakobranchus ocellatus]|uniref:Apolipoprotein b-100 n=1 Tax=Plakobranchus ocellatus TaxID=259542 RepID=A0AAV4BML1_9GAST|nr:apolipoprotein b-100 [Plakobranchus ocellatus]